MKPILLKTLSDTKRHAQKTAQAMKAPALILISGDLGAGKTEWVRAFVKSYLKSKEEVVNSPTYSLVNIHEKGKRKVVHMDLYRVNSVEDLESTGFWDYVSGNDIMCIEWGERIPKESLVSKNVYYLNLKIKSENSRMLTCFFESGHKLS